MKRIDQLSLGWQTDLIFARFDAQVIARPDYLLVRTPHNPTFWWGNFLLFDHAPVEGEGSRWLAWFESEIASQQNESSHIALGVDASEPFEMPADLQQAGLVCNAATTLMMKREQLRMPITSLPASFRFAQLDLAKHASAAVELQVASDMGEHGDATSYRLFRSRQMQRYQAMHNAGMGHWFGIFAHTHAGEMLVADCGLFRDRGIAPYLGRFQFVSTHPEWRRRGLCRALIYAVCRHGFDVMGLNELVIVADPEDVAIRAYESLGFQRGASKWHIERGN